VTTGVLSDLQQTGISVRTPSVGQLARILQSAGGTVQAMTDRELLVRGLAIDQIGDRACAAGIALHGLAPQVGPLEDLFMHWTGGGEHPVEQHGGLVCGQD
jgi:hypothetical protein